MESKHTDKLDQIIAWQDEFDKALRPKIIELVDTLTKAKTIKEFLMLLFKLIVGAGTLGGLAIGFSSFVHSHLK